MYILDLFDFNEIGYNMMVGIYSVVAHLYDLMLDLVTKSNFEKLGVDFASIIQPIYILAGIFMLFRLVVSFLNYIVEPDKATDSQTGAGKMITRVIVAIILLMLLRPGDSIIYNTLNDIQDALLEDNGLISNIANQAQTANSKKVSINSENEGLITTVNAANSMTCYYRGEITTYSGGYAPRPDTQHVGYYKLKISSKKFDGAVSNNGIYVKFEKETKSINRNKITTTVLKNFSLDASKYSFSNTCPDIASTSHTKQKDETYKIGGIKIYNSHADFTKQEGTNILMWPGESLAEVVKDSEDKADDNESVGGTTTNVDPENPDLFNYPVINASGEALNFATGVAGSFVTCNENTKECNKLLDGMFKGEDQNIIDEIGKTISFSFIPSILVGIVVIIFLIVLCVDVVVRSFKLFLLQMIAPIPIISYIDPKDKKLSEWAKMYLATYADLFIKLLAIKLGSVFLNLLWQTNTIKGLESIFWIFGILVFVKGIPSMISKLLGIDLAAGTFKDSMSMIKKGIGVGAGAALGFGAGVAGAAVAMSGTKGQSFGNKMLAGAKAFGGGVVGGTLSGAGAGSKGIANATKNAKSNFSKNWNKRELYKAGLTETDLMAGSIANGAMGYAARVDRANKEGKEKAETLEKFTKFKGAIEETAESGKFMKTLRQNVATGKLNLDENIMEDYRDTWVEYQIQSKTDKDGLKAAMDRISTTEFIKSRKNFQATLESKVSTGEITQRQMNAALKKYDDAVANNLQNNEDKVAYRTIAIQQSTGIILEEEAGKQAGIISTMTQANATLEGSKTVGEVAGVTDVTSFADLKNANTKVKKEATKISDAIFKTEADDKYQISKAAQEASKDKK